MAGGGEALGSGGGSHKRGKTSKRKKKKRLGFRLDMTPLVDITFLLLTFFMFTTTMLKPQMMDMKLPPEIHTPVDVPCSQLFTLMLRNDGKLFYQRCEEEPKAVAVKDLMKLAKEENLKPNVKNKLITFFKIASDVKYDVVVKVLDELNLAEGMITDEISRETDPKTGAPYKRERKFTIGTLEGDDLKKVEGL